MNKKSYNQSLNIVAIALAALLAFGAHAGSSNEQKEISRDFEMAQLSRLTLDANVGSVHIAASNDDIIHVYVRVTQSENWRWFHDPVQDVELKVVQSDTKISLGLNDDDFGEEWIIELPRESALDIQLGVGAVEINGMTADIAVDVGVGEVKVTSLASEFSQVQLDTGVGGTNIMANNGQVNSSRAIVSEESSWFGTGAHQIAIEVGVGDATVKLQ